jgi:CRP-like cAMP-binding protein
MVAIQTLARMDLFEGLPDQALAAIAPLGQERSFAPGETIVSEGYPAEHIYLLQEGTAALFVSPSSQPARVNVSLLDLPGQTFGSSALVGSGYYTATVKAVTDVHAVAMDGLALLDYFEQNPAAGYGVMRRVAQLVSYRLATMRALALETV